MTRVLRTARGVVCAALASAALAPCPAFAGSYVVRACSPETTAGLWTEVNTAPAGFASGNLCGGPEIGPLDGSVQGSLYAEDILHASTVQIPNGARAGWMIGAPPGALITAISYYRTLASYVDTDLAAGLFLPDDTPLEQCRIATPFGSTIVCSMPNNQVPVVFEGLRTPSLFFGVLCDIVTQGVIACDAGSTIHNVQAYMYSARVTISEDTLPTVSDVGGPLWAGGLVSGTVAVKFAASDASGIRTLEVQTSAGQAVASTSLGCDFRVQPPCPNQSAATLNVDTTRVADGPRAFRLIVTDAAGNRQVVASPPVIVDNHGPPPPVGLTASAPMGSNLVALSWRNPAEPPAPIEAGMVQLCSTSCAPAVRVDASGSARVAAPGPGAYSVRVWLVDVAGRGGPHHAASTSVVVASPPPPSLSGSPGPRGRIGALLRGRRLRVSGPLAVSGRVVVGWRSKIQRRTVGHGSRTVTARNGRVRVTFAIPRRARTRAATIRVVVRSRGRVVGQARASRG